MPYLWAQANKTHQVGVPMMRSMIIAFSDDTACKYLDQQYMLGDNLCIVPVMNEEGIAEFYVPDCGTWTDIQSGETYEGGKYYTRKCDYFQTPILARPNSYFYSGTNADFCAKVFSNHAGVGAVWRLDHLLHLS